MSPQCLDKSAPKPLDPWIKLTAHVGKLLAAALQVISVFGLYGVLDGTGHGVIGTQDIALHQLDLTRGIALQTTATRGRSSRCLSLGPRFGRGCSGAGYRRTGRHVAWVFEGSASVLVIAVVLRHMVGVVGIRVGQAVALRLMRSRRVRVRVVKGALVGSCRVGVEEGSLHLLI